MEEEIIEPVFVPRGDMYLKFASEAEALSALYKQATHIVTTYDEEGTPTHTETLSVDEDGAPVMVLKWDMVVDMVGTIYKATGKMLTTDEGDVPEVAPVAGYHVNTRGEMPVELEGYATTPATPVRVWA
jgi:hypothetical protein